MTCGNEEQGKNLAWNIYECKIKKVSVKLDLKEKKEKHNKNVKFTLLVARRRLNHKSCNIESKMRYKSVQSQNPIIKEWKCKLWKTPYMKEEEGSKWLTKNGIAKKNITQSLTKAIKVDYDFAIVAILKTVCTKLCPVGRKMICQFSFQ